MGVGALVRPYRTRVLLAALSSRMPDVMAQRAMPDPHSGDHRPILLRGSVEKKNDPYGPAKTVSLLIPLPMGAGLNAVTVRPRAMQRSVMKPNFDMVISS